VNDLFDLQRERVLASRAPLATRLRPRTLDEFVGQGPIVGPGTLLRRIIEADRLPSLILWGPPGTGKTTLARIIAATTKSHFVPLSAVSAGVADLRAAVKEARERLGMHGARTILFIDEVHRFNKAQQDAILPHVEDGTVTLIGATTENPSFEVNAALLSRARVFVLRPLGDDDLRRLVERALADRERGLGEERARLTDEALALLVNFANGDARFALNTLELAVAAAAPDAAGARAVDAELVAEAAQRRAALYDKAGESHYDTISALHKSLRDSDPDGALYWLARMLESGEDPLYVTRRLVRFASEDVGLADPQALVVAMAAQGAVHFLGWPEANTALAQLAIYLATAPKSNAAYAAYGAVREDVERTRNDPVPLHLRNAPTGLMRGLGYGRGYQYAHDHADAVVSQQHLPDNLAGRRYYTPTGRGFEVEIAERMKRLEERRAANEARQAPPDGRRVAEGEASSPGQDAPAWEPSRRRKAREQG
jgi:putative ATPase